LAVLKETKTNDREFREHFKCNRASFKYLVQQLRAELEPAEKAWCNDLVEPAEAVGMTLLCHTREGETSAQPFGRAAVGPARHIMHRGAFCISGLQQTPRYWTIFNFFVTVVDVCLNCLGFLDRPCVSIFSPPQTDPLFRSVFLLFFFLILIFIFISYHCYCYHFGLRPVLNGKIVNVLLLAGAETLKE